MGEHVITWEQISKVAHEAVGKIIEEKRRAYHMLREGEDLPGIWPEFFLYHDLSWSVGYKPEGHVISKVMVQDYTTAELIDALEPWLMPGWTLLRARQVVPAGPAVDKHAVSDPIAGERVRASLPRKKKQKRQKVAAF